MVIYLYFRLKIKDNKFNMLTNNNSNLKAHKIFNKIDELNIKNIIISFYNLIIKIFHLYDFYLLDLAPAPPNFFGSHLLGSATNKVLSYCKRASLISLFDYSSTNFWLKATIPLQMAYLMA